MYTRTAAALGFAAFPIWSRVKGHIYYEPGVHPPEVEYYKSNRTAWEEVVSSCNALPLVAAATSGTCVNDFRSGTIVTPLAEFEHALLNALEHIGVKAVPSASPLDLLDGAPDGTLGSPVGTWDDEVRAQYAAEGRKALCRRGARRAATSDQGD